LPSAQAIDLTKLHFVKLSPESNISTLDCTEDNGADPLGLQEFILKEALTYQAERIGVTYLVLHEKTIVVFLTVSMNCLSLEELQQQEMIPEIKVRHPALLLGRLVVDKRFRNLGIGTYLCQWVIGLARYLSELVGCRYVALHTLPDRSGFYKREPLNFTESSQPRPDKKKLLYRKITSES